MKKRAMLPATGLIAAVVTALLGAGMIMEGGAVGEGIRRGLSICGDVLIPALFPFMALSCWLNRTDAARILSLPLTPLTRHAFRLRQELGATVLLSVIGGYPVGARMVSVLLEQKRITPETAERMLCFCYGGSPSFLISAVGAGMLLSRKLGVMLYAAQVLATLLTGALMSLRAPKPPKRRAQPRTGEGAAGLVAAVNDATTAMLAMCAWAILFSGLLSLLAGSGLTGWIAGRLGVREMLVEAVLAGIFEVTGGCLCAARLGGRTALLLVCLTCSFGGLGVLFQVFSCFREPVRFGQFLRARLLHAALSAGLFMGMARLWGGEVLPAMLPGGALVPEASGRPWLAWGCILAMCTMLLFGYRRPKKKESC